VALLFLVLRLAVLAKALVFALVFSLVLAAQPACQMWVALNINSSWSEFVQWVSADNHVER
jgi:hypothetical protein